MQSAKIAALLAFAACWLSASLAAADRVAALVPQVKPTPPVELRDQFHEAISRGLQSSGTEVLPAAEVRMRLGTSDELLNCAGVGPCVARSAQSLSIDRIVASDIMITGKDYTIKLRLLDPVGRELAKVDEPCDICTVKEADEAMTRAAAKLTSARPASTEAKPTPPPAKAEPVTPLPAQPSPPPARDEVPAVTPAPPAPTVTARPERRRLWFALALASLAAGVVGIASGAALVAIDGQPTCSLPNPRESCPDVYSTVGGGATLLTFGLVSLAASGTFFYLDYRTRHKARPTISLLPLQNGAFLSASGRF